VLGFINKSHRYGIQVKTENIFIRDKACLGDTMRDKTFSEVKIESARKEHQRSDIIVSEKLMLTNRDHPYPIRDT
jgi:hypothetical protein